MTENAPVPATTSSSADAGVPFYENQRRQLHQMIHKRRLLERSLAMIEDTIAKKESDYLEDTPNGNIITGFENYTKGTSSVLGARGRRGGNGADTNRVFSRSSISYNGGAETPVETASSTPVAAMAPTPFSASFVKGDPGSSHATPTSASSGKGGKKNKKAVNGDDSDTDARESKKIRTNFGASRK